jgi:hypothetical protein
MMEDNKIAKKFISAIIEEEVIELNFANTEYTAESVIKDQMKKGKVVAAKLMHLDFVAKIRTNDDYKTVIIEMQKSTLPTDIMRFREYIGIQYQSPENSHTDKSGKVCANEIYCIFFLGDGLQGETEPVIKVTSVAQYQATNKKVKNKHEFINTLHHKSWIILIPGIPKRRRNDLEKLLAIFDQEKAFDENHFLTVEDDFPEEFRPIVRRLSAALQNRKVMANMKFEDRYLADIRAVEVQKDYIIGEKEKARIHEQEEKEKAIVEKEKAVAEKEEAVAEKEKALAEKEKALAEKEKERAEKEKALAEKEKALAEIAELKRLLANQ